MSGFMKPSSVRPYADHGAVVSSSRESVPFRSAAPTVITNGSLPGEKGTPLGVLPVPQLPAAATTTTPLNHSFSTALSSGSRKKLVFSDEWSEKLATRMLYRLLFATIH